MRFALDLKHFKRGVLEASKDGYDVLHISCHGDDSGIALSNNKQLTWNEFAECFQQHDNCPKALIMSSCCGAAAGIGDAFSSSSAKPKIIFGSIDERNFDEYAVAWSILYKEFNAYLCP